MAAAARQPWTVSGVAAVRDTPVERVMLTSTSVEVCLSLVITEGLVSIRTAVIGKRKWT